MEAVQIAGGFTHEAKHSQVVLFDTVNDDLVEARIFDMKKMLKEKSLSEIPSLRPGDLVFVHAKFHFQNRAFSQQTGLKHVCEFSRSSKQGQVTSHGRRSSETGQGVTRRPTVRELAMVLFRQRKLFVGVSGLVFGFWL